MKFTIKTLAVAAPIGLGACLLMTSVSQSQDAARNAGKANGGARIPGFRPINPNAPILKQRAVVNPPAVNPDLLLTPEQKIEKRIADMEAKIAQQDIKIAELNRQVNAAPAGYTKAFINMGGFRRLPDSEGVSYWARVK